MSYPELGYAPTVRQRLRYLFAPVFGIKADTDGSSGYFSSDEPLASTTPSKYITLTSVDTELRHFEILEVRHRLNPTNSVTYQLYLLEKAETNAVLRPGYVVYDSGSGKSGGTSYQVTNLFAEANLHEAGKLYYLIDWSGDPGTTTGYIIVKGRRLW